ncbi:MAG: 2-hydroxyacid dehydrogenase [Sphingobacteriales bacterium]|nr:MAG: 2-hydroxyacid dehydrogenase [Sphingobacteriales bacterium]
MQKYYMKAIVYSTRPFEINLLNEANNNQHQLTLLDEPLTEKTIELAAGNAAIVVFTNDEVSESIVKKMKELGVKYIATRSVGTDHINKKATEEANIVIANVPSYSPHSIAEHAVMLALALNRKLILASQRVKEFDFRLEGLTGFNLFGKTVGLIGLGTIGKVTAGIFNGFGCNVIAYDIQADNENPNIKMVSLDQLYASADIISLHIPATADDKYLINSQSLAKMKKGVMIINTGRGSLIHTTDALEALNTGQLGYLGADVYENEHGLFFENHRNDAQKDPILLQLLAHPNVIITPHQAFLTIEALKEIAAKTIENLNEFE